MLPKVGNIVRFSLPKRKKKNLILRTFIKGLGVNAKMQPRVEKECITVDRGTGHSSISLRMNGIGG